MLLGRFAPQIFAVLRIIVGLMFSMHGSQKLLGWPGDKGGASGLPPLMLVAGVVELVCGLLVAIGFFADWAAFIASGEMAVAYFTAHAPHGPLPILNKGEDAVLYCFIFLFIAAYGSGIWSVDAAMRRR